MIATTNWLKSAGCQGLEYLDIKESFSLEGDSSGYGCFAKKTFAVGDILFTVPQQCIFSLSNVIALPFSDALLRFADGIGKSELVSAEFLIWLEMCRHKANPTCHFHAYFASLPSEDPTVYNWSDDLQSCFEATNIAAMLHEQNKQRLQAQFDLFRTFWAAIYDNDNHLYDVLSSDASYQNLSSISMETFMWARGMYLSRRYPDTYAMPPSGPKQPPGKIGRESNFGNTGALVPLLDILNHRPGNCWLVFNATPTELQVVCNHPIAEGAELYSNYGPLPNEILLYAYGFAIAENPDDSVAVKLYANGESNVYYIKEGGFDGVPQELWKVLSQTEPASGEPLGRKRKRDDDDGKEDEGSGKSGVEKEMVVPIEVGVDEIELLYEFVGKKYEVLISSEERCTNKLTFIENLSTADAKKARSIKLYRNAQAVIMQDLLQDLQETLDAANNQEESEDENEA